MTINKIVVMGSSFTLPGQSGITKCWSQWLEEQTNIPVVNLTWTVATVTVRLPV